MHWHERNVEHGYAQVLIGTIMKGSWLTSVESGVKEFRHVGKFRFALLVGINLLARIWPCHGLDWLSEIDRPNYFPVPR